MSTDASPDSATPPRGRFRRAEHATSDRLTQIASFGLPFAAVLMTVIFVVSEPTFASYGNFKSIVVTQVTTLLLATAICLPLRCGDFDLSVASTLVVSGAIVVRLYAAGWPLWACVVVTLVAGGLFGVINAIAVVSLGLNSFIVTLATMTILEGLGVALARSQILVGVPHALGTFTNKTLGPFPLDVYYAWILVVVVGFVFEWTPYGRYMLVVGMDRVAALRLGLPTHAVRYSAYVLAGMLASFAGLLLVGFVGAVDPTTTGAYILPPYAAAFLGSTTIRLGQFNVVGTFVAVYFVAIGVSGLELLGVSFWITNVFSGASLLVGLLSARILTRRSARALSAG